MPIYITDKDATEQLLVTDDQIVVTETGSITSLFVNGIGLSDEAKHVTAMIYGSVSSSVFGVNFSTSDSTLLVGTTGSVYGGETGVAIGLNGLVQNNGQISGLARGILVDFDNAGITNNGTVFGAVGIEDGDNSDGTVLTNFGTVTGMTEAIRLGKTSHISNNGTIQALGGPGSIGIHLETGVHTFGGPVFEASVTNRGTIIADVAIKGDEGHETIINEGHIQGNVELLDGHDLYDGRNGTIIGTIDLGDGADTGYGGDGEEHMLGGAGADELHGEGGIDFLDGGNDNDLLDGGTGSDVLVGGLGDDTYLVDEAGDVVTEAFDEGNDTVKASASYALANNLENLILTGNANLSGTGNDLVNIITGNSGNNLLDGGGGVDDLRGGLGDDTYIVSDVGDTDTGITDTVTEDVDGGTDTVRASVNFTLGDNVENLTLTGTAVRGIGNELANIITGNAFNNLLDGGSGADRLIGGDGNDIYVVDHKSDVVVELAGGGSDTVEASVDFILGDGAEVEKIILKGIADLNATGNTLANTIMGNAGKNILDGGSGADLLSGGDNDDTYLVDDANDVVTELVGKGSDTVKASISYALANDVENLILTGIANLSGTGNELANVITGNEGNNVLDGGGGADDLRGGLGDDTYIVSNDDGDTVSEGVDGGTDLVKSNFNFTLTDNVENLTLTGVGNIDGTGNALANVITGNAGTNLLDGGKGADRLIGGDGNDIYMVDNEGDTVVELQDDGRDAVLASISYTLGANVENLVLTGIGNNGTGNGLANSITGNAGKNVLDGGAGGDILDGGAGDDTLDGGSGADFMSGGDNDDTYMVDDGNDVVAEFLNKGSDTVRASISYALANDVENLVLTGSANLSGTGNDLANTLMGNAGDNHLEGGKGDDQIDGGAGHNTAVFSGAKANYTITANTDGSITVEDQRLNQDGKDTLRNIQSAQFSDGTFSITPPPAPTVQGSVNPINENASAHSFVASVKSNALAGDSVTYALATNPDNKFAIDANTGEISLVGSLDYEAVSPNFLFEDKDTLLERKYYLLEVRAIADGGLGVQSAVVPVKVYVNNLNEAPTVLSFTDLSHQKTVGGVIGNGTAVGTLLSSDPDANDQLVYSFDSNGLGGSSGFGNAGGLFKIEGGVLKFAHAPNVAEAATYTVTIKVTDKNAGDGSKSFYKDFQINVVPGEPINTAPTINVQNGGTTNATDRGSAVKPFLNKVLISDDQANDALDVTIAFAWAEGALGGAGFDGVKSSATITYAFHGTTAAIKAILDGLTFTPSNHHDAGPDITTVFTITAKDETHAVVSNGAVNVVTDVQGDPPEMPVISIAADEAVHNEGNSGFTDFTFTVSRTDTAGAPTAHWQIVLANGGVVTADDFDQTTGTVNFAEGVDTATITVKVKGDTAVEGDETFTVQLSNASAGNAISLTAGSASGTVKNDDVPAHLNGTPNGIVLNGPGTAEEYAVAGKVVGALSASDPDAGDTFSYTLLSATDRFDIVGGRLVVKNGYKLDFEQATSHEATVRVTDQSGAFFDKTFTIGVVDINPEITAGSADNDVFKGGALADKLGGGLGDDTLWGGLGKDTLTGGVGKDIFVFSTKLNKKTNLDKIADFNVKDDSIWLDNAIFKKLGKEGAPAKQLSKSFFTVGDKAHDKNDYLVYNKSKGVLYYDIDGSGAKAAVEIATTKKNLKMTYKDFFVI